MAKSDDKSAKTSIVLPSHRVPAHLARRFQQICLGVTAEVLIGEDLTPLHWSSLATVIEQPGRGQRQIAELMGIDPVTFGQMIDFLEERGLVERKIDPEDRRAHKLYATGHGLDVRQRLRPTMLGAQERLLAPLSGTERAHLLDLLVRVIEANESYARPGNGRRKPRRSPDLKSGHARQP